MMSRKEIIDHLLEKPSYIRASSPKLISNQFGISREDAEEILSAAKELYYQEEAVSYEGPPIPTTAPINNTKESRVLVVGDLHEPFTRIGYLEFCYDIYLKYKCNKVVLIGDIIDNHFSSFHNTDPDGHSAAVELEKSRRRIQNWYKVFPQAKVCLGNHDLIITRQAFKSGVSSKWVRTLDEVLDVPDWEFEEHFIIDGVQYVHGVGRKAHKRMLFDGISTVQGHYHSESNIIYSVGVNNRLFSMQIGCGVEDKSYAMAYGKHFNKMHINCGVVLENGTLPILEYMKL